MTNMISVFNSKYVNTNDPGAGEGILDIVVRLHPTYSYHTFASPSSFLLLIICIQAIMGTARNCKTYYWGESNNVNNPFLLWIQDVLNQNNPPYVHSVSYTVAEIFSLSNPEINARTNIGLFLSSISSLFFPLLIVFLCRVYQSRNQRSYYCRCIWRQWCEVIFQSVSSQLLARLPRFQYVLPFPSFFFFSFPLFPCISPLSVCWLTLYIGPYVTSVGATQLAPASTAASCYDVCHLFFFLLIPPFFSSSPLFFNFNFF